MIDLDFEPGVVIIGGAGSGGEIVAGVDVASVSIARFATVPSLEGITITITPQTVAKNASMLDPARAAITYTFPSEVVASSTVLGGVEVNISKPVVPVRGHGVVQPPTCRRLLTRGAQGDAVSSAEAARVAVRRRGARADALSRLDAYGYRIIRTRDGSGRYTQGMRVVGWDADAAVNSQERVSLTNRGRKIGGD